jgi:hypothetical protein
VGPSECIVRLFTSEVTSDQTWGNWYHFIKPIHRIKNLLKAKWLLNVVSYFVGIIFLSRVAQTAILKNAFYGVRQRALWMGFWNQGGGGLKKCGNF